jgi:hypothetical protein
MLLAQAFGKPDYTTNTDGRAEATDEMFNITSDWRDKGTAPFDPMDAVILRGDRNGRDAQILQFFWSCYGHDLTSIS